MTASQEKIVKVLVTLAAMSASVVVSAWLAGYVAALAAMVPCGLFLLWEITR